MTQPTLMATFEAPNFESINTSLGGREVYLTENDLKPSDLWKTHLSLTPDSTKHLANLILTQGQLQPIIAAESETSGSHEIIDGHRRRAAFALINQSRRKTGIPPLDVWVRLIPRPAYGQGLLMALSANLGAQALNEIEKAHAVQILQNPPFGWTDKRIAEFFGNQQPWVSKQLQLLRCPQQIQELVAADIISKQTAIDILPLPESQRSDLLRRSVETGHKLTSADVRRQIRTWRKTSSNRGVRPGARAPMTLADFKNLLHHYSDGIRTPRGNAFRHILMLLEDQIDEQHAMKQIDAAFERGALNPI